MIGVIPESQGAGGWRGSRWLAILAVAVTLLCLVRIRATLVGDRPLLQPLGVVCAECQASFPVSAARPAPYRCEKCGKDRAYPALQCFNCKKVFLSSVGHSGNAIPSATLPTAPADSSSSPAVGKNPLVCPQCKSPQVMPWVPSERDAR